MFNQYLNIYPDDYKLQGDDEYDVSDDGYSPHGSLVSEVSKMVETLRRAAYSKGNTEFEVDCALVDDFLEKVHGMVRKPWFREAAIIALILLFKTGLFLVYREARKVDLEIVNL